LLDEPTANLDENNAARVEQLVKQYLATHNASAIWVSHDDSQLQRIARKRYHLSAGQLTQVAG
jgi:ABC-type iron transport system FetAB ATPase subunit